ncbi:MAG: HEPN domain-containing protein [bacterium]
MPERSMDWLKQAEKDLRHAKNSIELQDYEWSCFAAQQAAEKAVKALYQKKHMDAWGHTISILLSELNAHISLTIPDTIIDEAKILDKHYIPARYPNGFESGAPFYFYTEKEAQEAVRIAEHIIEYCKGHIG